MPLAWGKKKEKPKQWQVIKPQEQLWYKKIAIENESIDRRL